MMIVFRRLKAKGSQERSKVKMSKTQMGELRVYEWRHKQQQHEQPVTSRTIVTTVADVPINSFMDPSQAIDNISDYQVLPRRTTRVNAGRPPSRLDLKIDISKFMSYAFIPPAYKFFLALLHSVPIPNC
jgi:hypothetical protein